MSNMIPCVYIGEHEVELNKYGGPYFDGAGQRLVDLKLRKGDTLMMPDEEVLGYTVLRDMSCNNDPVYIGVGRVVLPQDARLSDEELYAMGYQFHQGRPDFEKLEPVKSTAKVSKKDGE